MGTDISTAATSKVRNKAAHREREYPDQPVVFDTNFIEEDIRDGSDKVYCRDLFGENII